MNAVHAHLGAIRVQHQMLGSFRMCCSSAANNHGGRALAQLARNATNAQIEDGARIQISAKYLEIRGNGWGELMGQTDCQISATVARTSVRLE